jgi:hypothetical protein
LTAGEAIDEILERTNTGTSEVDDTPARKRAWRALQMGGDKAWTLRPIQRRFASGTVSVTINTGVGLMPSDCGSIGSKFHAYVQNQSHELEYMDPSELMDMLETNPNASSSLPDYYTLRGETGGRQKLYVYPKNSAALTLAVENYQVKAPKLVDRPSRPVGAQGVAGAITAGVRTYKVTFVTADGETEGGETSESVTIVINKKISVTEIPVSPSLTVTSRKLYRTVAAGEQHKLVATIADNVTTTYLDNVLDVDLGANVPTTATGVSGLERFPEDHHRTALVEAAIRILERGEGDGRAPVTFPPEIMSAFTAMWADDRIQHVRKRTPAYGAHAFYRR